MSVVLFFTFTSCKTPSIGCSVPPGLDQCLRTCSTLPPQVKLWYDKVGHQLIVTILGAKDLPPREDGRPRNPYVKIYFLPDRR